MKPVFMKLLFFVLLFPIICCMAGIYGFLHDQISFTVSPEYFTLLKFSQFNIPDNLHNRIGAGIVGILATWWMGLVIGVIIIPVGLVIPNWKNYFKVMLKTFIYVSLTALLIGIIALIYGLINYDIVNIPQFSFPDGVVDKVNFAVVGNMHNFSYIGGIIGIIIGIIYIIINNFRIRKMI
jgi:hypothetical protein